MVRIAGRETGEGGGCGASRDRVGRPQRRRRRPATTAICYLLCFLFFALLSYISDMIRSGSDADAANLDSDDTKRLGDEGVRGFSALASVLFGQWQWEEIHKSDSARGVGVSLI